MNENSNKLINCLFNKNLLNFLVIVSLNYSDFVYFKLFRQRFNSFKERHNFYIVNLSAC